MKYYIVWYNSINQYWKNQHGYYVSYRDKLEDNFSKNYIDAKRYKTLGFALSRLGMNYTGYGARDFINKLDFQLKNSKKISRRRKLSKLDNKDFQLNDSDYESINMLGFGERIDILEIDGNNITFLGKVSNKELYDHLNKESDKFLRKNKFYTETKTEIKDATPEDIDDFCSTVDNILKV